jgi:hypothetical protein
MDLHGLGTADASGGSVDRREMPNVFLAGVPKAGTSALASYLAQHPQFTVSAIKEPNYFNTDLPFGHFTTPSAYLKLFKPPSKRAAEAPLPFRCDASILYCYSTVAAQRIAAEAATGARAVVVLRDPVDVMHAWHAQMRYTCNETIAGFADALDAEAARRARSSTSGLVGLAARCPQILWYRGLVAYAPQVERFQRHLGAANVLVLLYEDLTRDTAAAFRTIMNFLGADAQWRPSFERVNEGKERRWPGVHRAMKHLAGEPARRLLSPNLRHRMISRWDQVTSVPARRPPLPPALRARLIHELRPEVEQTATLLARDLSAWLR